MGQDSCWQYFQGEQDAGRVMPADGSEAGQGFPGSGTAPWDVLPKLRVKFLAGLNFSKFHTGLDFFLFNYLDLMILGATIGCGDENISEQMRVFKVV